MKSILDQYNDVLSKIREEQEKERDSSLSALVSLILEEDQTNEKADSDPVQEDNTDNLEHEKNIFALLCLKEKLRGKLLRNGLNSSGIPYGKASDESGLLEQDLEEIVSLGGKICYQYEITEEFLNDIRILLTLLDEDDICLILPAFVIKYELGDIEDGYISQDLFYLSNRAADAYERLGYPEMSSLLLENLCTLSRERNNRSHRELVVRILERLAERAYETAIRIAQSNESFYENTVDQLSGDFYWLYGTAVELMRWYGEAEGLFRKCYHIHRTFHGDDNWYTAVSKREFSAMSHIVSNGKNGREALVQFVDDIEDGKYLYIDRDQLKILEGKTLYLLLWNQSNITDLDFYDHYLSLYEDICEEYDGSAEPLLKQRLARNLRGGYYFKSGDYIQAESTFLEAIQSDIPDTVTDVITVPQIKINLLMIYYVQNDVEMARPLLLELLDLIGTEALSVKDEYRVLTLLASLDVQTMSEPDSEELEMFKDLLDDGCMDIIALSSDISDHAVELTAFVINAVTLVAQNEIAGKEDQSLYLEALDTIIHENELFPLDPSQCVMVNLIASIVAMNIGDPREGGFISNAVRLADEAILPLGTRIGVFEQYAYSKKSAGEYDTVTASINKALAYMEDVWKPCVRYMNDDRLIQILSLTQLQFLQLYILLRIVAGPEAAYERILQFKNIASLAAKERNRILHSSQIDEDLLREIRFEQDRIAALETDSMFRENEDDYENARAELRKLESEFARRFPLNNRFVTITYDSVQRSIPDNSVVIEYFFCSFDFERTQFKEEETKSKTGFDVFVTQKKGGECRLSRIEIDEGERILSAADEFIEILQAQSNGSAGIEQLDRINDVRAELYKRLIAPIRQYLEGFETVYIAPDSVQSNLPFEILYDEEQEKLEDFYTVIKIECARDFLYKVQGGDDRNEGAENESLIIGNPAYEVHERNLGDRGPDEADSSRMITMDARRIKQLPFSQAEVEMIGKCLGSRYYTGSAAAKQLLFTKKKYRNIHIATHGYFETATAYGKEMYSSCLLFSGVCNWLKEGRVSKSYGNGIITADEISRLDLKGTELVVLSSCLSGMNEISLSKGFLGMIGAFSAAGVHYCITHLWEANDFSTAVLMDAFYHQYAENKQSPPKALSLAKSYLKQLTIGDLRKNGWLDLDRYKDLDPGSMRQLLKYQNTDDSVRPFKGEAYWAGFACYQCY